MRLSYYLLLLVTLVTCTTQSESENNRPALATSPAPNPPRATTSDTSSVFLFNVPSLLGKNIDEIERQLGKPTVKDEVV